MTARPPDTDEPESSDWLFSLIGAVVVAVVASVSGLPWWAGLLIAVAVGLVLAAARRRWPTV